MSHRNLCAAILAAGVASSAAAVPVTFGTTVETATGSSYYFTDPIHTTQTLHFLGIATDQGTTVDLRISSTIKTETLFAQDYSTTSGQDDLGYIPGYETGSGGEPNDDLGFQYIGQNLNATENGIQLTFDFFDGTGVLSGSFTNALTISKMEWAIYDVDGEPSQTEFFRASISDGLYSYRVGNTAQALVATQEDPDTIRFDGPGSNFSETDASGAAILTYLNTSSFTLDFGAVQSSGGTENFVFSGIDGDLSMFDLEDFNDPFVVNGSVPLPAGLPLLLASLGGLMVMRRRRS